MLSCPISKILAYTWRWAESALAAFGVGMSNLDKDSYVRALPGRDGQANRRDTVLLALFIKSTNDSCRSAPGTEFIAPCPIKDEYSQLSHPS